MARTAFPKPSKIYQKSTRRLKPGSHLRDTHTTRQISTRKINGGGGAIAEFEGGDNNSGGRTIAEFAGFDFTSTALQEFFSGTSPVSTLTSVNLLLLNDRVN